MRRAALLLGFVMHAASVGAQPAAPTTSAATAASAGSQAQPRRIGGPETTTAAMEAARSANRTRALALVDRAIAASGGERALSTYAVLAWKGEATVHAGDRTIPIVVDTVVHPEGRSVSRSWRTDQGEQSARTLTIDAQGGDVANAKGEHSALPAAVVAHEREQYALYQILRLVPLRARDVTLDYVPATADRAEAVRVTRAGYAPVEIRFARDGRVESLANTVVKPDDGRRIAQVLRVAGTRPSNGVAWFERLSITWDAQPFFDLKLTAFEARPR